MKNILLNIISIFLYLIVIPKKIYKGTSEHYDSEVVASPVILCIFSILIYKLVNEYFLNSDQNKKTYKNYIIIAKIELAISIILSFVQYFNTRIIRVYAVILFLKYLTMFIIAKKKKQPYAKNMLTACIYCCLLAFALVVLYYTTASFCACLY